MTLDLKVTTVFSKNYDALTSGARFIKNEGGSRSSKTYSLCQMLIIYALQNKDKTISIIRKTLPSLKASVMRDFFEVMKELNLYNKNNHNKSENIYTFDNGSMVEFFSADDEQKLRGRKRHIAWCNEANELFYDDFQQINLRTEDVIIVDYNPSEVDSYLYYLPEDKTVTIHSTYKDNPFLPQAIIEEIEAYQFTDEDYYTIFALGKRAFSKENVYSQWKVLDERPNNFKEFVYGLDFGYTHPLALVKVWYDIDSMPNEIYIEELIYESHLTTPDLLAKLSDLEIQKNIAIASDYARPEIIQDIKNAGYYAINAIKDVKDGINNVKTFKVLLDAKAKNIVKENQNYKYKKVNGQVTEEVMKKWDDAMDAIRYAVFYIKKTFVRNNRVNPFEVINFSF